MSYLIDGNNLIGRLPEIDPEAPDARMQLLRWLAAFRNRPGQKARRLTVVFDGAPEPNFPDGSVFQGVHIIYSLPNSTADARIKQKVEQHKDRRGLTVVTSDRELYNYVRACGAQAITCEQFVERLWTAVASSDSDEKEEVHLDAQEIDQWMRYFGIEEQNST